jgi:hypothetical protein
MEMMVQETVNIDKIKEMYNKGLISIYEAYNMSNGGIQEEDPFSLLKQATIELSMRCDGARMIDGVGFNKPDTGPGKWYARKCIWSWQDAIHAHNLLLKYRKQLGNYGIDLEDFEMSTKDEPCILLKY